MLDFCFCAHSFFCWTYIETGVVHMRKRQAWWPLCYMLIIFLTLVGIWGGERAASAFQDRLPLSRAHTLIIDAGHGGEDGGATSCTGRLESEYNLAIALRLEEMMQFLGYQTMMIRRTDTAVYTKGETIAQKKVDDLKNRVKTVNDMPGAVLLSIHQNYFPQAQYNGAQVFYANSTESKALADAIQTAFATTLNPGSRRTTKAGKGIYLLEKCEKIGVLVECGFLSNIQEEQKLSDPSYQKQVAAVIAAAVSTELA